MNGKNRKRSKWTVEEANASLAAKGLLKTTPSKFCVASSVLSIPFALGLAQAFESRSTKNGPVQPPGKVQTP